MKFFFAILLFAVSAANAAETRELTLNPTPSLTCQETLENVRSTLNPSVMSQIIGSSVTMEIGVYKDLRELALASEMDRSTALNAVDLLSKDLERNRGKKTVLGSTLKYLELHQKNELSLLICVLRADCHLSFGTIFVPDQSKVALGPLNPTYPTPVTERPTPHLILMNGGPQPYGWNGIVEPPDMVALTWAIDFLTGLISYTDYELISDWIKANTALLQAGQRSDELFDQYARVVPRLKVNTGFYHVFSSSRMTVATMSLVPPQLQTTTKEVAMREIKAAWRETEHVVIRHGLSASNIVEFAERVTRQMEETIAQAEKLPKH